ncbi:MAG TPA: preprotein translocase subunit SecA [Candidatus Omnitrophota bacterium]|nr:preprotein translocase subunit SecA [Candidatus Omnitrophota bacterium]HNQ50002.1 preprotein translocase subunit SecA [Candidatus Omnitrophota bacterium]HQO37754.1 preprotein translocase subunit SecA [Candidatus Omnitrophota bacterium]
MPVSSIGAIPALARVVAKVNALEPAVEKLSDAQLAAKTAEFRQRIAEESARIEPKLRDLQEQLLAVTIQEEKDRLKDKIKLARNTIYDGILPEAFAVVREASRRTIGLRHFDVQIAGGIILHEGKIAEMATGEGKTLVATLPAYLNALLGKGVHVVTVNDYLAKRDSEWMGPVYQFLGLSVGVIQHDMSDSQRQHAYGCDITYGTNNEFGFDYLRDNMKYAVADLVQREFYYAIVDEVDSILIDEARTPLIISGASEESTDKYAAARRIADQLGGRRITENDQIEAKHRGEDVGKGYDYIADEKAHTISLTEEGESKAARLWNVADMHSLETMELKHHTQQALRAKEFYKRDREYIVKDGQVVIVDEFTGRLMPGRRWSDGLHQAIESKEGMKIEQENQTLATITFQNYFRMYEKLAGMTGTAFTEANEFKSIYKLDVVVMPTNRPLIRINHPDMVYKTEKEKFKAVVDEIVALNDQGRPVLVGTISIDKSELLGELLKRRGIPHQVLNAKFHEMEAQIVAQAGRFKGVTIATNMAGRGTDILLGGNAVFKAKNLAVQKLKPDEPGYEDEYRKILERFRQETQEEHEKVVGLGGLHVLGTERHEARRIDNQLRGRCGRQGDPGSSRFYVSLEDDLMRLFGSDRLAGMMTTLGLEEGEVINHPWVSKSIEVAQRRVETHNFEIRKQLLEYDNVMNKQREVIYTQRRAVLEGTSLKEEVLGIVGRAIDGYLQAAMQEGERSLEAVKAQELCDLLSAKFGMDITAGGMQGKDVSAVRDMLSAAVNGCYEAKEAAAGPDAIRYMERMVFLQIIDTKWKDHLYAMDKLREGIGLRAYGHRDPLIEYKNEAFNDFSQMIAGIEDEAAEVILKLQPERRPQRVKTVFDTSSQHMVHPQAQKFEPAPGPSEPTAGQPHPRQAPPVPAVSQPRVGRNDPCPCGSGKKYKKCCGQ